MKSFRQFNQIQADIAEHEAWQAGKRPLPHEPRDPTFLRMYAGGFVTLVDLEDGTESRAFRVDYEEREQQEWMREQRQRS